MSDKALAAIDARLSKLRARRDAILARGREAERKTEARRLILIGRAYAERAKRNLAFQQEMEQVLDAFLTRPVDRALFPALQSGKTPSAPSVENPNADGSPDSI